MKKFQHISQGCACRNWWPLPLALESEQTQVPPNPERQASQCDHASIQPDGISAPRNTCKSGEENPSKCVFFFQVSSRAPHETMEGTSRTSQTNPVGQSWSPALRRLTLHQWVHPRKVCFPLGGWSWYVPRDLKKMADGRFLGEKFPKQGPNGYRIDLTCTGYSLLDLLMWSDVVLNLFQIGCKFFKGLKAESSFCQDACNCKQSCRSSSGLDGQRSRCPIGISSYSTECTCLWRRGCRGCHRCHKVLCCQKGSSSTTNCDGRLGRHGRLPAVLASVETGQIIPLKKWAGAKSDRNRIGKLFNIPKSKALHLKIIFANIERNINETFLFDPSSGEKTPFRFVNSVKRYFACWIGWEWYASLSGIGCADTIFIRRLVSIYIVYSFSKFR